MRGTCVIGLSCLAAVSTAAVASAQVRLIGIDAANVHDIDPLTGTSVIIAPISGGSVGTVGGLAFDPASNTLYMASTSNDNLWRLNYQTGVATLVGGFAVDSAVVMHGLEWADGRLYGHSSSTASGANFYEINPMTGAATPIAITSPGGGFGSMGYVPETDTMYMSDTQGDSLYTINRSNGALALVGPMGVALQVGAGMAYHPDFGMLGVNNSGTDGLYKFNLANGSAGLIGNMTSGNMLSIAFVPTPGAMGLAMVAGVAAARRKRG